MRRAKRRRVRVVSVRMVGGHWRSSFPPPDRRVGNFLVWDDLQLSQWERVPAVQIEIATKALRERHQ